MDAKTSPVRVVLEHEGQSLVLQAGSIPARGWRFDFRKTLASPSQPFDVLAERGLAAPLSPLYEGLSLSPDDRPGVIRRRLWCS